MWIILGVLLSFSALALEPSEKVKGAKILKVLPNNILMIDRGLEDGVARNDHIMLTNEVVGYASRAICIRSSFTTSYLKLYRIPDAEAISLDYQYTLVGIDDREIPSPVAKLRDRLQATGDEKKIEKKVGADPFLVKRDLPERLTERDLLKATGPEKRKLFVERVLNEDQLKRDLNNYQLSLFASPFTRQSINEGESLRYGFRGGNVASKYRLLTGFEQQQTKLKDPVTEESVSTRSTKGHAQFIIDHLKPSLSTLSLINYNSMRFSSMGTPKNHWQVGPIGFTWHLYESKSWEYLDLSYVPLYDIRVTDIITENGKQDTDRTTGIRHGFRLAFKNQINERVAIENILWVRPFQDLATWKVEGDNLNLENDMKLVFNISGNLYFDYNFIYQKDKLWETLSGLPQSNTINSLNVRYDFNL
jgi:hypothetical protein